MNEFLKELQEVFELQKRLEAKLKRLEKLISINKASKQERQTYRSLKGQIQSLTQKQRSLKTSLAQIKTTAIRKAKEVKTVGVKKVPVVKPKLTREQVFAMYRKNNTDRFVARILEFFPGLQQSLPLILFHLDGASDYEIYEMIKKYSLRSTWFDSEGSWDQAELVGWNQNSLLHAIRGIGPIDDLQRGF